MLRKFKKLVNYCHFTSAIIEMTYKNTLVISIPIRTDHDVFFFSNSTLSDIFLC